MAVISELIRAESDGTISFGDYTLEAKSKLDNFDFNGAVYKVKTFKEITKLEKNGMFVYESVPGTAVSNLSVKDDKVSFFVEGLADVQVTLELEPESEYDVSINSDEVKTMKTNLSGKLSLSVELEDADRVEVLIKRV